MHMDAVNPYALIVAADGSTLVAMRYGMDPLRSLDAGLTWTPFSINGQQRPLAASFGVQIAPTNSMTWYAIGDADGALYLSTDGGTSWGKRSDRSATQLVGNLVAISADPQVIYRVLPEVDPACDFNECPITKSTLQISNDGGLHWRDLRSVQGSLGVYASPVDPTLAFTVGPDGLGRSRDAGTTWTPIAASLPIMSSYGRVAFDRFDAGVIYFVPISGDETRIFASADAGATWTSATAQGGHLVADPVQTRRAFLFAYFGGTYETRDGGATWVHVEPAVSTSINGTVGGVVLRDGQRFAINAWDSTLRQLDLNNGALALTSDIWWNPAQSGWGMSITHHSSTQTFVAWFAYDRNGDAVWRVIPGGQWSDRVFTGDVYETTGPPYFGVPFDATKVAARRVGNARIAFDDENDATFTWQLDEGLSGSQRVVRERFGVPVSPQVVYDNFADLWWNAAESGWGMAINHQYDNVFAAWYTYDSAGHPLWIVMPDAKMRVDTPGALPKATGALYTTHGPSASVPFDPSKVTLTQVGTATLTFASTGQAQLDYTAFGRTESKAIARQPF